MSLWRLSIATVAIATVLFLAFYLLALNAWTRDRVTVALSRNAEPASSISARANSSEPATRGATREPDARIDATLNTLRTSAMEHRAARMIDFDYGREAVYLRSSQKYGEADALLAKQNEDDRMKQGAEVAANKAIVELERQMFSSPIEVKRAIEARIAREGDPKIAEMFRMILKTQDSPSSQPGRYNSSFAGDVSGYWYRAG
jgi:hypothetical protein